MPTPRQPVPFQRPFTTADLPAHGLTARVVDSWLTRGEVLELAPGVFAPTCAGDLERLRRIHTSRGITRGTHCVSVAGAAALHRLCTPPSMPERHSAAPRPRDVENVPLVRVDGVIAPSRIRTAIELARRQTLPSALIPLECVLRNGITRTELRDLHAWPSQMRQWPGSAVLERAVRLAKGCSGSPLESYSRGLLIEAGLPLPEQQTRFVVDGHRYYVDFHWPRLRLVGEADGEMKFDEGGVAQFAQHRRQARLQSLGLTVIRWGWPDLYPDATRWLAGMRMILAG